jgi:hypothetical protein
MFLQRGDYITTTNRCVARVFWSAALMQCFGPGCSQALPVEQIATLKVCLVM